MAHKNQKIFPAICGIHINTVYIHTFNGGPEALHEEEDVLSAVTLQLFERETWRYQITVSVRLIIWVGRERGRNDAKSIHIRL